jgi:hypothetical protein
MFKNMGVIRWIKFNKENKFYMLSLSRTYFDLYKNYYWCTPKSRGEPT